MVDIDNEQDYPDNVVYAIYQLEKAEDRLNRVKERAFLSNEEKEPEEITIEDMNPFFLERQSADMILDLQLCIELPIKSMFIMLDVEHPYEHGITLSDHKTEGLLNEITDDFPRKDEVPRAVFLTQFWHQFYELTKYGVPRMDIKPIDLIGEAEAKRAIEDAEHCVDLAKDLIEHEHEEVDMENIRLWL